MKKRFGVGSRSMDMRASGLMRVTRFGFAAGVLAATACSSEPHGEFSASVEQALEAGQFVVLNEVEIFGR